MVYKKLANLIDKILLSLSEETSPNITASAETLCERW